MLICAFLRKWNKRKNKNLQFPTRPVLGQCSRGLCHSLRLSGLNSHVALHLLWGLLRGTKVTAPSHHP